MSKRDYYEVLGVAKNSIESEIKKAYRTLSKEHHPDKGGDEEKFKEVAEAYGILSDPTKRGNYDTYGHGSPQPNNGSGGGFNMDDIFSQFGDMFGGNNRKPQRRKGKDIRIYIDLSFEDVFSGVEKKIKYLRQSGCNDCKGQGGTESQVCEVCRGKGIVLQARQTTFGVIQTQIMCGTCNGEGRTVKNKCNTCRGAGTNEREEIVDVSIPIGISEGDILNVGNNGHSIKGGVNGDLQIHIKMKTHKDFTRDGFDLHYKLNLHYNQLVLGDKVEIPTIEGSKIRFEVPKHSQVGKVMRIPNKGLKRLNNKEVRGDLFITLNIIIPIGLDKETESLIKKVGEKLETININ